MSRAPVYARKRDQNEAGIVAVLRLAGASVELLHAKGLPDLLVGHRGRTVLIEVKNPEAEGGAQRGGKRTAGRGSLTPDQVDWFAAWRGSPVVECVSAAEAMRAIGALASDVPHATAALLDERAKGAA